MPLKKFSGFCRNRIGMEVVEGGLLLGVVASQPDSGGTFGGTLFRRIVRVRARRCKHSRAPKPKYYNYLCVRVQRRAISGEKAEIGLKIRSCESGVGVQVPPRAPMFMGVSDGKWPPGLGDDFASHGCFGACYDDATVSRFLTCRKGVESW